MKTPEPAARPAETASLEEVLESAIDGFEHDAAFDLDGFLSGHPGHAAEVRSRMAKLRQAGLLRRPQDPRIELAGAISIPERPIAGRYRVLREIGRGGMGQVLLARDERLERQVAIKLATRAVDAARARLEREAKILAQLDHPGIVSVHDGGTTEDGRAFCAMRVVGGTTLHDAIGGPKRLGVVRKLQIAIAVCDAVQFAHARGIVHRDLKPSNVMLGEEGEVQVIDWGLAKRVAEPDPGAAADGASFASFSSGAFETVDGYAFGTPSYCAPEQAKGQVAEIDQRSDVFGLGAILHHLLVGRPPYYGKDREEVLARARAGRINDPELARGPERVPAELVAVCGKACAARKVDRYASAHELAGDLQAFLEKRTVKAYRTGAFAELSKWILRHKLTVALVGACAVALAVAVLALLQAAARRELLLVSDIHLAPRLEETADDIAPLDSDHVPALDAWIEDTEALIARLPVHRRRLLDARERLELSPPADQFRLQLFLADQEVLIASIERLSDPQRGLLTAMRGRSAQAREIDVLSVAGVEPQRTWNAAIQSIADRLECPRYSGLRIEPQLGLLPIGRDPHSGLWEFAALLSGDAPVRRADGELDLLESSAVALVLVPGATFLMGAQTNPGEPNFDPRAHESEGPVCSVPLDPFFISKYELTQAQWERLARVNPSYYSRGQMHDGQLFTGLHPVENVSWQECERYLRLAGLALPTEAQWERAARAESSTVNWTGDDEPSIEGAANIADQACARLQSIPDGQYSELDDGWGLHAPVDFGLPNGFGLHGVIGNVNEWCRDAYASYKVPPAVGDGDRSAQPWEGNADVKVLRDASFLHSGRYVRVAHRMNHVSSSRDVTLGVRPARALDP